MQLLARTADLREGLERDEIEVAYQPVVTIAAGHAAGYVTGFSKRRFVGTIRGSDC